jgi:serine/threonine protein kinase
MAPSSDDFLIAFARSKGIELPPGTGTGSSGARSPDSVAKVLMGKGLREEHLASLLEIFQQETKQQGPPQLVDSLLLARHLAVKRTVLASDLWTAISDQERARASGSEKSLDWFLARRGKITPEQVLQALKEVRRKALVCRDCGRRELVPDQRPVSKPSCLDCQGLMEEAMTAADLRVEKEKAGDPLIGTVIGGCSIERLLGKGGMGAVYLARHVSLNKAVAVKLLSASHENERATKRFLREARAAARLDHPNVVQVFDTGTSGELQYIVMKFVEGESASAKVRRQGPLAIPEALRIVGQAAQGLAAAHRMGLIHRDVKPDNLMIELDGVVKVADFGLAKEIGGEGSVLTVDGQAMGTPQYMSPEQARDASSVGPATDIYSLGATLYSLLAGKPPFSGTTPWAVVSAALNEPAPDIRGARSDVPEVLAKFLLRTLEKEPARRPATMEEFGKEVSRILQEIEIGCRPDERPLLQPVLSIDNADTPRTQQPRRPGAAAKHEPGAGPTPPEVAGPTAVLRGKRCPSWAILLLIAAVGLVVIPMTIAIVRRPPFSSRADRAAPEPEPRLVAGDQKHQDAEDKKADQRVAVLETESVKGLEETKAQAECMLRSERFPEAIALFDGFLTKFKGTTACRQAQEERTRIIGVALAGCSHKIREMANRFGQDEFAEAGRMAEEISQALDRIWTQAGDNAPTALATLRKEFAKRRQEMETVALDRAWMDENEPRLQTASGNQAAVARERLLRITAGASPSLSRRSKAALEQLDDRLSAGKAVAEAETFSREKRDADAFLDAGNPDAADTIYQRYLASSLAEVRREAEKGFARVREFSEALAAVEGARNEVQDAVARGALRNLIGLRRAVQSLAESPWPRVRGAAQVLLVDCMRSENEIIQTWNAKGFSIALPYSGHIGSEDPEDANPVRQVEVSLFAISTCEVSRGDYAAFLAETRRKAPPSWQAGNLPEGTENLPVTVVSSQDASAYATWLGGKLRMVARLPTEDEWEVAAGRSGNRIQKYPWGDEFKRGGANLDKRHPVSAASYPGDKSPCGARDMAGNVTEWCVSNLEPGAFCLRGGCCDDRGRERAGRCAFRQTATTDLRSPSLGFRVLLEIP